MNDYQTQLTILWGLKNEINIPSTFPKVQTKTNWYILTGAPGSGKTSVLNRINNIGLNTVGEAGRKVIHKALNAGIPSEVIFKNQKLLQDAIFQENILQHSKQDLNKLMFFDRGLPDSLPFYQVAKLDDSYIVNFSNLFMYKTVFYFEMLPNFERNNVRPQKNSEIEILSKKAIEVYKSMDIPIVTIPVLTIDARVHFILKYLSGNQYLNTVL